MPLWDDPPGWPAAQPRVYSAPTLTEGEKRAEQFRKGGKAGSRWYWRDTVPEGR